MNRFLLFCHNKRPSYNLDFIIEEPLIFTYLQKTFTPPICPVMLAEAANTDIFYLRYIQ